MNIYELHARQAKVARLLTALDKFHGRPARASDVIAMSKEDLARVQLEANAAKCSPETIDLLAHMLLDREIAPETWQ